MKPKYRQISRIDFDIEFESDLDLVVALDGLPRGFIKNPKYGLGLAKSYRQVSEFIEDNSSYTVIMFGDGEESRETGHYLLKPSVFGELRADIDRIKARGDNAIRRVRNKKVRDVLGSTLGV